MLEERRVDLLWGDGLVMRNGNLVVVVLPQEDEMEEIADWLVPVVRRGHWPELLKHVSARIIHAEYRFPPIACLLFEQGRTDFFVRGEIDVELVVDGVELTPASGDAITWLESAVHGVLERATVGTERGQGFAGALGDGAIRGDGFTWSMVEAPANITPPPSVADLIRPRPKDQPPVEIEVPGAPPSLHEEPPEWYEQTIDVSRADLDRTASELAGPPTNKADRIRQVPAFPDLEGAHSGHSQPELAPEQVSEVIDRPSEPLETGPAAPSTPTDSQREVPRPKPAPEVQPKETSQADRERAPNTADSVSSPVAYEQFDASSTMMVTGTQRAAAVAAARQRMTDAEGSDGLSIPELRGVRCASGHLNPMTDLICRTCGVEIPPSGSMEFGPRPSLGLLRLDDGSEIVLDRPVVVGRELPGSYSIDGEPATLLPLTDVKGMISRVHLEIHLVKWTIELVDKNSANGTFIRSMESEGAPARIRLEQPTSVELGTEVHLGERSFVLTTPG